MIEPFAGRTPVRASRSLYSVPPRGILAERRRPLAALKGPWPLPERGSPQGRFRTPDLRNQACCFHLRPIIGAFLFFSVSASAPARAGPHSPAKLPVRLRPGRNERGRRRRTSTRFLNLFSSRTPACGTDGLARAINALHHRHNHRCCLLTQVIPPLQALNGPGRAGQAKITQFHQVPSP